MQANQRFINHAFLISSFQRRQAVRVPTAGLALILALTAPIAASANQSGYDYHPPTRKRYLSGTVADNNAVNNNPNHHDQNASTWNYGFPWYAVPLYWVGGFWGPSPHEAPPYVPLPPDSLGAALLSKYQLNQTPCEEPDLVVILGPDASIICAYPFGPIAPGDYSIDPSNLTLISRN